MKHSADIVIHINENLSNEQRSKLVTNLSHLRGVESTNIKENRPHLMIVGYDSAQTKPLNVLADVEKAGVHAQLVGWL